jgi:hypothetical protein
MTSILRRISKGWKALTAIVFPVHNFTQAGAQSTPECHTDWFNLHVIGCSDLDARWYCERERWHSEFRSGPLLHG